MPHIILVRRDGWTLGAPESLVEAAEALWADEWIGCIKCPSRQGHPLKSVPVPLRLVHPAIVYMLHELLVWIATATGPGRLT